MSGGHEDTSLPQEMLQFSQMDVAAFPDQVCLDLQQREVGSSWSQQSRNYYQLVWTLESLYVGFTDDRQHLCKVEHL